MKKGEVCDLLLVETNTSYELEVVSWVENEECLPDHLGSAVKRGAARARVLQSSFSTWESFEPDHTCVTRATHPLSSRETVEER